MPPGHAKFPRLQNAKTPTTPTTLPAATNAYQSLPNSGTHASAASEIVRLIQRAWQIGPALARVPSAKHPRGLHCSITHFPITHTEPRSLESDVVRLQLRMLTRVLSGASKRLTGTAPGELRPSLGCASRFCNSNPIIPLFDGTTWFLHPETAIPLRVSALSWCLNSHGFPFIACVVRPGRLRLVVFVTFVTVVTLPDHIILHLSAEC